jgi:hypothetical protein
MFVVLFGLVGCAPTIAGDGSDDASQEALSPGDADGNGTVDGDMGEGTGDGTGDDGAGNGAGSEVEEEVPEPTLSSGEWKPTAASIVADPCEWVEILDDYYGSDIVDLLPSEFEVDGEEGSFEIEAQSYGARGPITCTITEGAFDCEQQEVIPLAFDIGEYGWEYAIDFSGEVVDEQTIRGVAVVSYPGIDDTTAYWLDRYGISASDCSQTFDLELSWVD